MRFTTHSYRWDTDERSQIMYEFETYLRTNWFRPLIIIYYTIEAKKMQCSVDLDDAGYVKVWLDKVQLKPLEFTVIALRMVYELIKWQKPMKSFIKFTAVRRQK